MCHVCEQRLTPPSTAFVCAALIGPLGVFGKPFCRPYYWRVTSAQYVSKLWGKCIHPMADASTHDLIYMCLVIIFWDPWYSRLLTFSTHVILSLAWGFFFFCQEIGDCREKSQNMISPREQVNKRKRFIFNPHHSIAVSHLVLPKYFNQCWPHA